MDAEDHVLAQPMRSYLDGDTFRHPEDPPYKMTRTRFRDLHRNGLVAEAQEAEQPVAEPEPVGDAATEAPAPRRGRSR